MRVTMYILKGSWASIASYRPFAPDTYKTRLFQAHIFHINPSVKRSEYDVPACQKIQQPFSNYIRILYTYLIYIQKWEQENSNLFAIIIYTNSLRYTYLLKWRTTLSSRRSFIIFYVSMCVHVHIYFVITHIHTP